MAQTFLGGEGNTGTDATGAKTTAPGDNSFGNILGSTSLGDVIGMAGTLTSTFGPSKITQDNRAGDTPNINHFKNYGNEAMATLDRSKGALAGSRDANLKGLDVARANSMSQNRASARGSNTQRALDLATDGQVNQQQQAIYNAFEQQLAQIFGQESQMSMGIDQVKMSAEQGKDQADRADRDNYFSNMAQDVATKGTGLQKIGKDLNQVKTREVTGKIMADLFPSFSIDPNTGVTKFTQEEVSKNLNNYQRIPDDTNRSEALQNVQVKGWKWDRTGKEHKLLNKEGKEIDLVTLKPIE